MEKIETPTAGEILNEEFLKPLNISAYRLAKDIHVPVSRIQDILKARRKITLETSIKLGKYFGLSDTYFLNIQNNIDKRNLSKVFLDEVEIITPCSKLKAI